MVDDDSLEAEVARRIAERDLQPVAKDAAKPHPVYITVMLETGGAFVATQHPNEPGTFVQVDAPSIRSHAEERAKKANAMLAGDEARMRAPANLDG